MYKKGEPLMIKIKYFDPSLPRIEKFKKGNWIDLRSAVDIELKENQEAIIPLGVAMKLPEGYEAQLLPRSSTYATWGIMQTNSEGVIDNSYCGDGDEWKMPVRAFRNTKISKGDRICQFRIQEKMPEVVFIEVDSLGNSDRKGFGSTGQN